MHRFASTKHPSIITLDFSTIIFFLSISDCSNPLLNNVLQSTRIIKLFEIRFGNTDSTVAILVEISEEKREYMQVRVY